MGLWWWLVPKLICPLHAHNHVSIGGSQLVSMLLFKLFPINKAARGVLKRFIIDFREGISFLLRNDSIFRYTTSNTERLKCLTHLPTRKYRREIMWNERKKPFLSQFKSCLSEAFCAELFHVASHCLLVKSASNSSAVQFRCANKRTLNIS